MDWWLCRLQIKIKLKPMSEILSLTPQNVWKHFYALTQVPRRFRTSGKSSVVLTGIWQASRC